MSRGQHFVLVPIKAFRLAKVRLAPALPHAERAALARHMAGRVLAAARGLPVAVVCDDPEVAAWARAQDALLIWAPGRGLDGAVEAGVARLAGAGATRVTVAHADLPLATDLTWVGSVPDRNRSDPGLVTLVPDRRMDGTNVASVPAAAGFRFSYGPGSLRRHWGEAARLRLPVEVVREPLLAWDVDLPSDLSGLPQPEPTWASNQPRP